MLRSRAAKSSRAANKKKNNKKLKCCVFPPGCFLEAPASSCGTTTAFTDEALWGEKNCFLPQPRPGIVNKAESFLKGAKPRRIPRNFAALEKVLKRQLSPARPRTASGEGVRIGFFRFALREDEKKNNSTKVKELPRLPLVICEKTLVDQRTVASGEAPRAGKPASVRAKHFQHLRGLKTERENYGPGAPRGPFRVLNPARRP